ncbi:hypothetical protein H0H93_006992 [Arthromyces matolae]|nr:hypothetical protein H0H93_006992 [Arthromyces matolae]
MRTLDLLASLLALLMCFGSQYLAAAETLSSAVILPLYIYPDDNCTSWTQLFSAIPSNPSLEFLIIVNPNSGPGSSGSQPDSNYQNCVTQLRTLGTSNGNVKLIGYVRTGYGTRDLSDITADVDTYAAWNAAYKVEGIFFDEASTNATLVDTYQGYVNEVKSVFGDDAYITLNPGTWDTSSSSSSYFSFSDLIVTFENTFSNFEPSAFPSGTSTPLKKQAAIIHTGPVDAPIDTINTITKTLGLAASDDCADWSQLISVIPSYPTLEFLIVINPNSGPGTNASQPDANYQTCVTQLRTLGNSSGNVKMIGYVRTGYGKRDLTDINADVNTYAAWNAAYRPEGIFFDEASTDDALVETYQSYVEGVKTLFGDNAYITLNPGTWDSSSSSSSYFTFSNLIVTFENTYGNFTPSAFPSGASTPLNQQAAIIHTGPVNPPVDSITTITQTLGLAASFYSDLPPSTAYNQFPTNWSGFLDELVSTQA